MTTLLAHMRWLWWAPLIAATLHIVEEFAYPGGFADWDRAYRPAIRSSITPRFHIVVNAALLLACAAVALSAGTREGAAGWLTLAALLFSNTIFHIIGTVRTGRYSPGVVTAIALYAPMTVIGYWSFLTTGLASAGTALSAALIGGSYHAWSSLAHRARAK